MSYKVGFIGCGNMGFALAKAAAKVIDPKEIILSAKTDAEAKEKAALLGAAAGSIKEVSQNSEFIFLAVKPQNLEEIKDQIGEALNERKGGFCLISMLAGVSVSKLESAFGEDKNIIRIMPNTPVSVGEGMILLTSNKGGKSYTEEFKELLKEGGTLDEIPEKLIDAGTAISGCGPAFCFMFIDALADAGVLMGIPKDKATEYAVQTLLGSASLAKKSDETPSALKDKVTSPGGSTIEGVKALEEGSFRATVMNAVLKSFERTRELGN